ncbi:MAG: hypothetical protein E4H27_08200 [Anaerolineales bacterium]|nr:MAG: hypothetical protein E4H27_08200 [Anaerolineales bacterium]
MVKYTQTAKPVSLYEEGLNCVEVKDITDSLQVLITGEVMKALGFPLTHWTRKLIHTTIQRGTRHFSELCAGFDADIFAMGLSQALRRFLPNFITGCYHFGTSTIPATGPLLVTSNHPGAADALTALTLLHRDDIKIVLSGVPFTAALPNAQQHFIHVTSDLSMRSMVIREIIAHLKNGGAIFIFPTGHVTPDPSMAIDPEVIFGDWSQSIALILQRCPEANLQIAVISGVIQQRFLNSPICKLRKIPWRQQILAEFIQIIWQMMRSETLTLTPKVTFMAPVSGQDLVKGVSTIESQTTRMELHTAILNHAKEGLKQHIHTRDVACYTPFLK